MTTRPAYPGYFTQTYRIGDHLYSTGGSEAQKPPNRSTVCKQPYQWASEHNDEIKDTLVHRGLVQTDCDAARVAVANANAGTQGAFDLGTKLIGQKLSLTDDLAGQLRGRVGAVDGELAALLASMGDTQAAIDGKNKSLDAVGAYLDLRAGRYASERLCDPVQGDLERMRATLNESVRLLESALSAQQSEQKRLETRKELLLADIADKEAAMAIDAEAKGFSSANRPRTAPSVQAAASMTVPRGMNLMHAPYDPVMWRQNTNTLCSEAQKACHTAARLRAVTAKLIGDRAAAEREVYQNLVADRERSMRAIQEVLAATEGQISSIEAEMGAMGAQHGDLQSSYAAKQDAFGVAIDRLAWRATRPTRELVQDPAQRALGNEVAGLQAATRTLEDSAHRLTMAHDGLSKRLGTLQETIGLKSHFLQVEEAGAPYMAEMAKLCATADSKFAPFGAPIIRPITSIPGNRLSLSRNYATR